MHNLIKYSDIYSKTSRGFSWQYCIGDPVLDNNDNIIDFSTNNSILFKFKQKITRQTRNDDTKDFQIVVPLKYLSN